MAVKFGLLLDPLASAKALAPFPLSSSFVGSGISSASLSANRKNHQVKSSQLLRASAEGLPDELLEDSKFVPLTTEEPKFGPPVILLLGFELDEAAKIQLLLKELDGEFLKVVFCTEDMINQSLWEAVNKGQPKLEHLKIAKSLPRICFLSGLTGEEMMMFIDAFPESGLKPAVFAALVPNSANKPVRELIEEIMGDHEMLTSKESSPA